MVRLLTAFDAVLPLRMSRRNVDDGDLATKIFFHSGLQHA
jgi:hypothetical protein